VTVSGADGSLEGRRCGLEGNLGMTPLRAVTWLLTGPIGRVVAFFGDLLAAWGGWALRRSGLRRHPE
jgi:hypothetical protein